MRELRPVVQGPAGGHSLRARRLGSIPNTKLWCSCTRIARSAGRRGLPRTTDRCCEPVNVMSSPHYTRSAPISLLTTRPHYRNQPGTGLTLTTATPSPSSHPDPALNRSVTSGAELRESSEDALGCHHYLTLLMESIPIFHLSSFITACAPPVRSTMARFSRSPGLWFMPAIGCRGMRVLCSTSIPWVACLGIEPRQSSCRSLPRSD